MPRRSLWLGAILALVAGVAAACGGGGSKNATPTSSGASPPAVHSAAAASATGVVSSATPTPGATNPIAAARPFDEAQAKALLDEASLTPKDLDAGWTIMTDVAKDSAALAAAEPTAAASAARCATLASRLVTNQPQDVTSAYLTGIAVSYFSQVTVYKTADGATDCSAEAATNLQQPGSLARAFGSIFVNPDAVVVKPIDYPQTGDASFATALTGDISAAGTTVQLQIVIVAFRKGNVTAVVGTATSPLTNPTAADLTKYVDLVLKRISARQ